MGGRVVGSSFVGKQAEKLRLRHLAQHAGGQRVGLAVIVDVGIQAVHHIEMRVGEQFLERGIAHTGIHTGCNNTGVVGLAAKQRDIGQGRGWRRRWQW